MFIPAIVTKKKFLEISGMSDKHFKEFVKDGLIQIIEKGERSIFVNNALLIKRCESGDLQPNSQKPQPILQAIK